MVSATDAASIRGTSGALGAGLLAGIGAAIDLGNIENRTVALIGSATHVYATGQIDVLADSERGIHSATIAGGASLLVGLGGAISIVGLGGPVGEAGADEFRREDSGNDNKTLQQEVNEDIAIRGMGISHEDGTASAAGSKVDKLPDPNIDRLLDSAGTTAETVALVEDSTDETSAAILVSGDTVTIEATNHYGLNVTAGGFGAGILIGVGIGMGIATVENTTVASVGDYGQITAGSDIVINATDGQNHSFGAVTSFAGSAALVSRAGVRASLELALDTDARLGSHAVLQAANETQIEASSIRNATAFADGWAVGAVSIGEARADTSLSGATVANVDEGASVTAHRITVGAKSQENTGNATARATAKGGASGVGGRAQTNNTVQVGIEIGRDAVISSTTDILVQAQSEHEDSASSLGDADAFLTKGSVEAYGSERTQTATSVGDNATLRAGEDLTVVSDASSQATVLAQGGSGKTLKKAIKDLFTKHLDEVAPPSLVSNGGAVALLDLNCACLGRYRRRRAVDSVR